MVCPKKCGSVQWTHSMSSKVLRWRSSLSGPDKIVEDVGEACTTVSLASRTSIEKRNKHLLLLLTSNVESK